MPMPEMIRLKKRFETKPVLYDAHGVKFNPDPKVLFDAKGRSIINHIILPEKVDLRRELLQNIPKSHADLRPQEIEQSNEMKIKISSLGNDLEKARKVLLTLPEFHEVIRKPGAAEYIKSMDVDELIGFCDKLFETRRAKREQKWLDEIERLAKFKEHK